MKQARWTALMALCVLTAPMLVTGCGRNAVPASPDPPGAPTPLAGPEQAVTAVQPDLPGDEEQRQAFVLLGRLVQEHPRASAIVVTGDYNPSLRAYHHQQWSYDRRSSRLVIRREMNTTDGPWGEDAAHSTDWNELRYSDVHDGILVDLGNRAANDPSLAKILSVPFIHDTYGCPEELAINGLVRSRTH